MADNLIQVGHVADPTLCDSLVGLAKFVGFRNTDKRCPTCSSVVKQCEEVAFDWTVSPRDYDEVQNLMDSVEGFMTEYDNRYPEMQLRQIGLELEGHWNIQHYRPKEGYPMWHTEWCPQISKSNRFLVWMLYLNTVEDAGTEWLYQDFSTSAEKGKLVIWPAHISHLHRGIVSNTEDKWIATGWMTCK